MNIEKAKSIIHYMNGLSLVGFLLIIMLGTIAEPATLSVITFGIIVVSLLVSVFIPISLSKQFSSFKLLVLNNIPVFFTILLSIWSIIIYSTHFDKINERNVSKEFYGFSNMSLFVMAGQIYVSFLALTAFLNIISEQDKEENTKTKGKMNSILYLLTPLNILLLSVMHVILEFFSTDG